MGTGFSCFWRPALDGGKNRTGRPGTREKEIGFEREIPEFPKPPRARAAVWLHESCLKALGPWEYERKINRVQFRFVSGQKF